MSVKDVAKGLVQCCQQGQFMEAIDKYYSNDVVSCEPMSMPQMPAQMHGLDAIRGKNQWWSENNEVHSLNVQGPYINDNKFVVQFDMEVTQKADGQRFQMKETGVYTVENDKIVREEFFYSTPDES